MSTTYKTDLHFQHETGKDDNILSQEELLCYRPISQACHAYCKAAGLDQDLMVAVTTIIIFFVVVILVGAFLWVNHNEEWDRLPRGTCRCTCICGRRQKEDMDLERQGGGQGNGEGEGEGGGQGGDGEGVKGGYMDVLYGGSDGDRDGDGDGDSDSDRDRDRDSDGDRDSGNEKDT
ncbi:hypothetical protein NEUTE1DRAFT_108065 [Neurospora tetrasperma FGSC 2508]|uniref:Uncharacterized protein n=1 Tax=Neurospora tetrasperma (strain FGSC 2508 / ATCC MYA-4615 / P0657) TaxID=510951 RepID=F8MED7_NEUT8|nr:uncharacterized protein NEUTE1DRAFT_108065 [Neurospora tetrasperma FGSC 2508]EGO61619.1 hypothetical protein NEUTE1DRAFT_108065 [Neurospora tetrasperma FGSC 2508]